MIAAIRLKVGIDTPIEVRDAVAVVTPEGGSPTATRCEPVVVREVQGKTFRIPIGTTETLGKRSVVTVSFQALYGGVGKPATRLARKTIKIAYVDRHAIVECSSTIVEESDVAAPKA